MTNKLISLVIITFFLLIGYSYTDEQFLLPKEKPSIFKEIEEGLHAFMKENANNPTVEYYIPNIVTDIIVSGKMKVRVIPTNDNWFGVTYKEDKPMAVAAINKHITAGVYPEKLWS